METGSLPAHKEQ